MSKVRMFEGDEPRDRSESPRTTIVGGRPPEQGRGASPSTPRGLEQLLGLASVDPAFLALLVEKRSAVAEAAGVTLSKGEEAILGAVPRRQLEAMVARMPGVTRKSRSFLRSTAATAVMLLGGAALSACGGDQSHGDAAEQEQPIRQPADDAGRSPGIAGLQPTIPQDGGTTDGRAAPLIPIGGERADEPPQQQVPVPCAGCAIDAAPQPVIVAGLMVDKPPPQPMDCAGCTADVPPGNTPKSGEGDDG